MSLLTRHDILSLGNSGEVSLAGAIGPLAGLELKK